jgi:ribokinase
MAEIVVVGSLNQDLVVSVDRWPDSGETLTGNSLTRFAGGKGGNQAAAAAALGGNVALVGTVGDDEAGRWLRSSLAERGVDVSHVRTVNGLPTGTAVVGVERSGANRIVVIPGANAALGPADVEGWDWTRTRVLLLQLEVPMDIVIAAARAGRAAGATVVLDPAPARPVPDELWQHVDILVPNRHEAELLTGVRVGDAMAARLAAARLARRGLRAVVVKLDAEGALLVEGSYVAHVAGIAVHAIDTTAAGDAFAGALAVALAEGRPLASGVVYANRAAAISVTRLGAQASLPSRDEVDGLEPAGRTR